MNRNSEPKPTINLKDILPPQGVTPETTRELEFRIDMVQVLVNALSGGKVNLEKTEEDGTQFLVDINVDSANDKRAIFRHVGASSKRGFGAEGCSDYVDIYYNGEGELIARVMDPKRGPFESHNTRHFLPDIKFNTDKELYFGGEKNGISLEYFKPFISMISTAQNQKKS